MHEPPYRTKNMMPGMIMLWPWGIDTIPSGWHLCDGTMGTPDYRNKYLVGAGDLYNPGDTFGADSQTHTFTGEPHAHLIPSGTVIAAGEDKAVMTAMAAPEGTVGMSDNRPQSKAACWIMKL